MLLVMVSYAPVAAPLDGELLYEMCLGCHSPDRNRTGPRHCGLLGRTAGAVEGFEYTDAMRQSKIVWTKETLDAFLSSPLSTVPGTSMGFAGIADEVNRAALIEWLSTLDDSSPLCS